MPSAFLYIDVIILPKTQTFLKYEEINYYIVKSINLNKGWNTYKGLTSIFKQTVPQLWHHRS